MRVIAHRGVTAGHRENTVAAFAAALGAGAAGVELDVRRTGDGALVVHHDPVLPGLGPLSNLTAADLPGWLPHLEEALAACGPLVVVAEVKNLPHEPGWDPSESVAVKVAGLLRERGPALGVVSSFSLAAVDAARAAVPEVPTGWLTLPGYDQLTAVATAAEHGHTALHAADAAVTPEVVAAARAAGLEVLAWTVNEVARMEELASWGVEAVITDLVGRVPLPGTPGSG